MTQLINCGEDQAHVLSNGIFIINEKYDDVLIPCDCITEYTLSIISDCAHMFTNKIFESTIINCFVSFLRLIGRHLGNGMTIVEGTKSKVAFSRNEFLTWLLDLQDHYKFIHEIKNVFDEVAKINSTKKSSKSASSVPIVPLSMPLMSINANNPFGLPITPKATAITPTVVLTENIHMELEENDANEDIINALDKPHYTSDELDVIVTVITEQYSTHNIEDSSDVIRKIKALF